MLRAERTPWSSWRQTDRQTDICSEGGQKHSREAAEGVLEGYQGQGATRSDEKQQGRTPGEKPTQPLPPNAFLPAFLSLVRRQTSPGQGERPQTFSKAWALLNTPGQGQHGLVLSSFRPAPSPTAGLGAGYHDSADPREVKQGLFLSFFFFFLLFFFF